MVPKSVLNDLRRQRVPRNCTCARETPRVIADRDALDPMRCERIAAATRVPESERRTHALTSSSARSTSSRRSSHAPATAAGDGLLRIRGHPPIQRRRAARAAPQGVPVGLATVRIVKPGEEGFLRRSPTAEPDVVLVRNLGRPALLPRASPALPLVGDYALNIANELTADHLRRAGLVAHGAQLRPELDAAGRDARAASTPLASRWSSTSTCRCSTWSIASSPHPFRPARTTATAAGPATRHRVDLRDRVGERPPADRPTSAAATRSSTPSPRSAAEFVPDMLHLGVRHFRVELLRETADETRRLIDRYGRAAPGLETPAQTVRSLRVLQPARRHPRDAGA